MAAGLGGSAFAVGGKVGVAEGIGGMGASVGDRAASGSAGVVRTGVSSGPVQANTVASIAASKPNMAHSLTGVTLPMAFSGMTHPAIGRVA